MLLTMELKTWLRAEPGRGAKLAAHLTSVVAETDASARVDSSFIWQWCIPEGEKGYRPIPPKLAHAIERFTELAVMRWNCCPKDWYLLWPELKTHRDAPDIPTAAPAESTDRLKT